MPKFYCEDTAIPDTEDLEMLAEKFSQQVAVFTRMTKIPPLKTRKCLNVTFLLLLSLTTSRRRGISVTKVPLQSKRVLG